MASAGSEAFHPSASNCGDGPFNIEKSHEPCSTPAAPVRTSPGRQRIARELRAVRFGRRWRTSRPRQRIAREPGAVRFARRWHAEAVPTACLSFLDEVSRASSLDACLVAALAVGRRTRGGRERKRREELVGASGDHTAGSAGSGSAWQLEESGQRGAWTSLSARAHLARPSPIRVRLPPEPQRDLQRHSEGPYRGPVHSVPLGGT